MPRTHDASSSGNELLLASDSDCTDETLKDSPNASEIGELTEDLSSLSSYIYEENALLHKWNQTKRCRHCMMSHWGWLLYLCCAIIAIIIIGSVVLLIITHDHKNSDGCEPTVLQFLKPGFEQAVPDSSKCDARIEEKLKEKMLETWNHFSSVQVACESHTIFLTIVDQTVDKLYEERCADFCESQMAEYIKEQKGVDKCYSVDSLRNHLEAEFVLCTKKEITAALDSTKSIWLPMECKTACLPKLENYIKDRYVDHRDCYNTADELEKQIAATFNNCSDKYIRTFIEHEPSVENKTCTEVCADPVKKETLEILITWQHDNNTLLRCSDQNYTLVNILFALRPIFLGCKDVDFIHYGKNILPKLCK